MTTQPERPLPLLAANRTPGLFSRPVAAGSPIPGPARSRSPFQRVQTGFRRGHGHLHGHHHGRDSLFPGGHPHGQAHARQRPRTLEPNVPDRLSGPDSPERPAHRRSVFGSPNRIHHNRSARAHRALPGGGRPFSQMSLHRPERQTVALQAAAEEQGGHP